MSEKSKQEEKISVCDIMKNRTSEIVTKMEYQLPLTVQQYSDLYTAYLHSFDDILGTCYISQKEFFDKLNISQKTLRDFDEYLGHLSKSYQNWIDLNSQYWHSYVNTKLSMIKSSDQFVHLMMDTYANILAKYNSMIDSQDSKLKQFEMTPSK